MPLLTTLGLTRPPDQSDTPTLDSALAEWQTRRSAVLAQIGKLGAAIAATGHPASKDAIVQLKAIQANLTARPDTAQAIAELERYLTTDDIVAEAETPNDFGVDIDIEDALMAALMPLKLCVGA